MNKREKDRLYKLAYCYAIQSAFDLTPQSPVIAEFKGFDKTKDMLSFVFDGHKCTLLSVERPDLKKGMLTLKVIADNEEQKLDFDIKHFRFKTLQKIAIAVINELHPCGVIDDKDEEDFFKNQIANFVDTHIF